MLAISLHTRPYLSRSLVGTVPCLKCGVWSSEVIGQFLGAVVYKN